MENPLILLVAAGFGPRLPAPSAQVAQLLCASATAGRGDAGSSCSLPEPRHGSRMDSSLHPGLWLLCPGENIEIPVERVMEAGFRRMLFSCLGLVGQDLKSADQLRGTTAWASRAFLGAMGFEA